MTDGPGHKLVVLDGLRGVAALSVMVMHVTTERGDFLRSAGVSVDLFFVMSGFILCYSYSVAIKNGSMTWFDYIARRIIRLCPMFVVGIILGSLALILYIDRGLATYSMRDTIGAFICNLFYIPYLHGHGYHVFEREWLSTGHLFPANHPAWSLFFEMFANLFFVSICAMRTKNVVKLIFASWVILILLGVITAFRQYKIGIDVTGGYATENMMVGFPRVFFSFLIGVVLFRGIFGGEAIPPRLPRWMRGAADWLSRRVVVLYGLFLLVVAIPEDPTGLTNVVLMTAFCPFFVYAGALARPTTPSIIGLSRFLGWLSYPVYCLHYPVSNFIAYLYFSRHYSEWMPVSFAVAAISASVLLAIIATRFFEEPVRAALGRWARTVRARCDRNRTEAIVES